MQVFVQIKKETNKKQTIYLLIYLYFYLSCSRVVIKMLKLFRTTLKLEYCHYPVMYDVVNDKKRNEF